MESDEEGDMYSCVYATVDGEPKDLFPGDELLISYVNRGTTPLEAFLNFGFVPPDMRKLLR
jgi:hypothetical protein